MYTINALYQIINFWLKSSGVCFQTSAALSLVHVFPGGECCAVEECLLLIHNQTSIHPPKFSFSKTHNHMCSYLYYSEILTGVFSFAA